MAAMMHRIESLYRHAENNRGVHGDNISLRCFIDLTRGTGAAEIGVGIFGHHDCRDAESLVYA